MGLRHSFTFNGVTYPDGYSRISSWRGFGQDVYLHVCSYANQAAFAANDFSVTSAEYRLPLAAVSGDFYLAAYTHLRTLEPFAAAVDILESPAEGTDGPVAA